jgi:hypothetical protein
MLWHALFAPPGLTPSKPCKKWPVAGRHSKNKLFLIKITEGSFPATVKADRVRWVYEGRPLQEESSETDQN